MKKILERSLERLMRSCLDYFRGEPSTPYTIPTYLIGVNAFLVFTLKHLYFYTEP
jgi:hypothetical protein